MSECTLIEIRVKNETRSIRGPGVSETRPEHRAYTDGMARRHSELEGSTISPEKR
jgi:hypothetical protein